MPPLVRVVHFRGPRNSIVQCALYLFLSRVKDAVTLVFVSIHLDMFAYGSLPRTRDVVHRRGMGDVLWDEEASEQPLEILEGLGRLCADGRRRFGRILRVQPGDRSVDDVAVEVVRLDCPLLEQDRGRRIPVRGIC